MEGTPARTQSPNPQPVQNTPGSTGSAPAPESARQLFEATLSELRERGARVPLATYRVQLHAGFTFRQAHEIADYLHRLGVSDLYASPFFRARPDSTHGYDLVDHNALSPAIGSARDFEDLTRALARRGTGILLDFVPNHMGIGTTDNAWWRDVLEHGPSSLYASFFDIDWHPLKPELRHKVLLPVLGDHYGRVLEGGHLQLAYESGALVVRVYDKTLPVNPGSYPLVLANAVAAASSELGEEHESVLELQSILTGLRNLPPRAETSRARRVERRREAAVLKRRLDALVTQDEAVARAVAESVRGFNGRPGDAGSFRLLDALLEQQAYRLSYWRVAAEEINYRRFFDINDLAAIKMENPAVFSEAHRTVFELLYEGRVTALRIDHPDGLWDPVRYFTLLQRGYFLTLCRRKFLAGVSLAPPVSVGDRAESIAPWPPAFPDRDSEVRFAAMVPELERLYDDLVAREPGSPAARPLYLTVEKILSRGETLPASWPVHGTVGYEVANLITGVFVDPSSERSMVDCYQRCVGALAGSNVDFETLVYEKKKLILQTSLASELNVLTAALNRLSEADWYSRDFTLGSLNHALREVIACFPVYRTYVNERTEALDAHDRGAVERAVRLARRRNPTTDASIFKFLRSILALEVPAWVQEQQRPAWREFVMRFQQLTGPVMAKGLEDTAFYIYNRLVALNEVGGEPERYGTSLEVFHRANTERLAHYPHSMCATSTHDTKRSEDVRARICVLSELPDAWEHAEAALSDANREHRTDFDGWSAPDRNEEYLFFQSVLGSLPFGELTGPALEAYAERLVGYMRKATKEAKVNTSWINADPEYDAAVENYVRKALAEGSTFLQEVRREGALWHAVAFHGMWGALSQVLIKYCVPGVPDTYQGNELWDFSLVDPDNRRPVDYALRARLLAEVEKRVSEGAGYARELVASAHDGRIKLFVTYVALQTRRRLPALFGAEGAYVPLQPTGERAEHLVAFARVRNDRAVIVLAPRWTAKLASGALRAPLGWLWGDTRVAVPPGRYRNLFTGQEYDAASGSLELASVLGEFPVGMVEALTPSR